jgi:PleD family two-component response regulator
LVPALPLLKVTLSAGLTEYRQDEPIADTLQRADQTLYKAKASGRDRCLCFESSEQDDVVLLG